MTIINVIPSRQLQASTLTVLHCLASGMNLEAANYIASLGTFTIAAIPATNKGA